MIKFSEWQIQTEDDVPDDDGDEGLLEPEVYTQNLALQRLQQNAAKRTLPVSKVINVSFCSLEVSLEVGL